MWELNHKKSWVLNNWCFWTVVLEKTLESPLDCKEIQPVHAKGNQSWIFIGRTDAEAEAPTLWPRDAKSWPDRKDTDTGKDWGREEKGTEKGMTGWDGWMASPTQVWCRVGITRHEFEQASGVGDGRAAVHRVAKSRTRLSNWTELKRTVIRAYFEMITSGRRGLRFGGYFLSCFLFFQFSINPFRVNSRADCHRLCVRQFADGQCPSHPHHVRWVKSVSILEWH